MQRYYQSMQGAVKKFVQVHASEAVVLEYGVDISMFTTIIVILLSMLAPSFRRHLVLSWSLRNGNTGSRQGPLTKMRDERTPLIKKGDDDDNGTTTANALSPQTEQEEAAGPEPSTPSDTSSTGTKAIIMVLILGTIRPAFLNVSSVIPAQSANARRHDRSLRS